MSCLIGLRQRRTCLDAVTCRLLGEHCGRPQAFVIDWSFCAASYRFEEFDRCRESGELMICNRV